MERMVGGGGGGSGQGRRGSEFDVLVIVKFVLPKTCQPRSLT